MTSSTFDTIPMRLVGRLLEEGLVVENAWISFTASRQLALFVYFSVYPFSLEEGLAKKLKMVVTQAAVCMARHQEFEYFLAIVERPNGFQTQAPARIKFNASDIMRFQRNDMAFEDLLAGCAAHEKEDWVSRVSGAGNWSSGLARCKIVAFSEERANWKIATLLNRVPDLVHGALEYHGIPVDAVDVRHDDQGILSLYVEFPIDEKTENLTPQYMASIVHCMSPYLKEFPAIDRLMIWTRPEYEDAMVAISRFYVSRQDVLDCQANAQDIQQLLNNSVSCNPRALRK